METDPGSVTVGALREHLPDVVNRANYGHERVQITRHGKPVAFLIGVDDFARLEELEDAVDLAEFRAAKAEDDGRRVSLAELQAEL
jgi:prevent-host-death family protein